MNEKIAGVLLAGGHSRRFGSPKAFAEWRGKHLYEYPLKVLDASCSKTVIITNSELEKLFNNQNIAAVHQDLPEAADMGPLGGLYTAMQLIEADWYMVLSCDTPLIPCGFPEWLTSCRKAGCKGVVPVAEGKEQPLTALYHQSGKSVLQKAIGNGDLKMKTFYRAIDVVYPEADRIYQPTVFQNINTKSEFQKLP